MEKVVLMFSLVLFLVMDQNSQAFDPQGGNAPWGKYAIQTCRTCHKEKGVIPLESSGRSSEDWKDMFSDNYKKLREIGHDFSAVGINDKHLENVYRYLIATASSTAENAPVALATPSKTKTFTNVPPVTPSKVKSSTKILSASPSKAKSSTKVPSVTPSKAKSSMKIPSTTFNKAESSAKITSTTSSAKKSDDTFDMTAGRATTGMHIFRKCLSCHKKNKAPIISPGDRTKIEWRHYFIDDYAKFKKSMPEFDTYNYTTVQMQHLYQFVVKYALDSEKPKTCD